MRPVHRRPTNHRASFDWIMLAIVLVMVVVGMLIVFDASYAESLKTYHDTFYLTRLQIGSALIGIVGMGVCMYVPLSWVQRFSKPIFIVSLLLLFLVLLPFMSREINGARRWLNLGTITLQPSELIKLALILYLPTWFQKSRKIVPFLILAGIVMGLIMLEPDMGTALIVGSIIVSMLFLSGIPVKQLIASLVIALMLGVLLIVAAPYRRDRLMTFLHPTADPLGSSYHIRQVLLSIGSGRVFGTGIGRSRQKYQYLPEVTTDSIFAVIAEEMGLWGGLLTIFGFAVISYRGWECVKKIPDPAPRMMGAGIIMWITTQALVNMAAMVALIPLTGVPLPLFSYGGSSLVMILSAVGLYQNCIRYRSV